MLKLVDITKDYRVANGRVPALKGINLSFRKNEFVSVLGPSGCGKTTLLNIIGGLDHYTSGDLVIQGKTTKRFTDRDWDVYRNHRIGFIFQTYNLIPHQTVLGNVELALTIAGISREERRARAKEALERVGLGEELNKRPNQLSGGQMQRVAIARALVNNPDILLADEPTGALDSKTSVQIMELIKEIAGERLVIMVTHNPELAEQYSSRIVRLKDGLVEADSNPYEEEEEILSTPVEPQAEEEVRQEKPKRKKKKARAKMGFFTSLALSARNLLTKKGRTVITSIAGSIGIISVCLVLALSNGFSHYIKNMEEDMLSYYPVEITESTMDMSSLMSSFTSPKDMPDLEQIGDKVYIDSFLVGLAKGMAVRNNVSQEYINYVKELKNVYPEAVAEIQYFHGASLVDSLYTNLTVGGEGTKNDETGLPFPETTTNMSLSGLKSYYINELNTYASQYSSLVGFADFFGNIVNRMPGTGNVEDENFGAYVQSQYDVVKGSFPTSPNEAVLVVGPNNEVSDLTLAQLGLLDESQFLKLFEIGKQQQEDEEAGEQDSVLDEDSTVPFEKVMGKTYTLMYNDAIYTPNPDFNLMGSNNFNMTNPASYPYIYSPTLGTEGREEELQVSTDKGIVLTVTGILRLKDGLTYGCLEQGLNLTEQVAAQFLARNLQSQIVQFISQSGMNYNGETVYMVPPSYNLHYGCFSKGTASTSLDLLRYVGGDGTENGVSIYARDFAGKELILDYLDEWNDTHPKAEQITYSDTVGVLMGMMQMLLNAITYVLVAFTAISLVVSSVMIGIITYVSVVERVKEIGVLRSLGARKQDIRNLFNAETFIIGLSAGVFGVVVSYLLSALINAILKPLTGIVGLASLNPLSAFIMICVSVGLTLISGLIPAQAAAKKDPVIALRSE